MANGNYFLRKLSSYVSSAPQTYVNGVSAFSGGLNTSKSAHLIEKNETPYVKNLMYKNGGLYPRMRQILGKLAPGRITACYEKPFYSYLGNPHMIFSAGGALYSLKLEHFSDTGKAADTDAVLMEDEEVGEITAPVREIQISGAYDIPETRGGTFFEFGGCLYYKARGCYIKIEQNEPENGYKLDEIFDEALGELKKSNLYRVSTHRETVYCEDESTARAFCAYAATEGYIFGYEKITDGENSGKYYIHGNKKENAIEALNSYSFHLNIDDYAGAFKNFSDFLSGYLCALKNGDGEDLYTAEQKAAIADECGKFMNEIYDIYYPEKTGSDFPEWFPFPDNYVLRTGYEITDDMTEEEKKEAESKNAYVRKLKAIYGGTANKLSEMSGYFDGLLDRLGKVATGESLSEGEFKAASLSAGSSESGVYVPTVGIGLSPNGTGAVLLQAENRLTPLMRFKYSGDGETKKFYFPKGYEVDLTYKVLVDRGSGDEDFTGSVKTSSKEPYIEFSLAPAAGVNNVSVTFAPKRTAEKSGGEDFYKKVYKNDSERRKAYDSFMECDLAAVYGGGYEDVTVVFGGSESQKNAYFWSGVGENADPTYIPFDYYNLTSVSDAITGFGVQQALLAIFSERSVGKANLTVEDADGLSLINLAYNSISTTVGCDVRNSIQLIENCLVFANTHGGVYRLSQTSDYNENCVERLSEKVNADGETAHGLLGTLRDADTCCSFDDGQRYMLFLSRHSGNDEDFARAFVWDYSLYYYTGGVMSWFYWEGIDISGVLRYKNKLYAGGTAKLSTSEGDEKKDAVIVLDEKSKVYSDFGSHAIPFVYVIPPSVMGSYANEKEVAKAVFTVDRDIPTDMVITYITDFERRRELTDIIVGEDEETPFSMVFVRRPRALRVHHLSVRLECERSGKGFSLLTSQIFFKYMQEERTYLER